MTWPGLPECRPNALANSSTGSAIRSGKPSWRTSFLSFTPSDQHELSTLSVVVFGTVSAGKTSLINALIGREVGTTEAVMGTTRHGESHTYQIKSVDATR